MKNPGWIQVGFGGKKQHQCFMLLKSKHLIRRPCFGRHQPKSHENTGVTLHERVQPPSNWKSTSKNILNMP